jgi:hypothetical protein
MVSSRKMPEVDVLAAGLPEQARMRYRPITRQGGRRMEYDNMTSPMTIGRTGTQADTPASPITDMQADGVVRTPTCGVHHA